MPFENEIQNIESETEIVQGYDNVLISVLTSYINDSQKVGLCEYGRGNSNLFDYINNNLGASTTIIEDFNQTIFQADRNKYKGLEDHIVEYNVLNSNTCDEKFDLIFASLPNFVPQFDVDVFQQRLNMGFENMMSMLNPKGYLISVDYNTSTIKQAVKNLNQPISKYIVTNDDEVNPEHFVCVVYKSE